MHWCLVLLVSTIILVNAKAIKSLVVVDVSFAYICAELVLFVYCGVETLEDYISVLATLEILVNILQNRGWVWLNYTDIVHSTWTDFDYFTVKQRLD
jgi:hypothetical protein